MACKYLSARRFGGDATSTQWKKSNAMKQQHKMEAAPGTQDKFIVVETGGSLPPGVALIKLNRPHAMNALSLKLCEELVDALEKIDAAEDLKCVVLTGEGEKAFAAGADIKELAEVASPQVLQRKFLTTWKKLHTFRKEDDDKYALCLSVTRETLLGWQLPQRTQ